MKRPCGSCPYRLDCPSGLWAEAEYDKLPPYDLPTAQQPYAAFFCHQQDDTLCSGWVGCHDMENNIGLRLAMAGETISMETYLEALHYECPVPLFESGQAAHDHGVVEIDQPSDKTVKIAQKLTRKLFS